MASFPQDCVTSRDPVLITAQINSSHGPVWLLAIIHLGPLSQNINLSETLVENHILGIEAFLIRHFWWMIISTFFVMKCWLYYSASLFKSSLCKIKGIPFIENGIHKYVFISVSPENKKCCIIVTLEWAFYIGSSSSSTESAMLNHLVLQKPRADKPNTGSREDHLLFFFALKFRSHRKFSYTLETRGQRYSVGWSGWYCVHFMYVSL